MLIIPPRPCCTVEPSQQNAGLVNTTAGVLENQLTRMGFITVQQLLNMQEDRLRRGRHGQSQLVHARREIWPH